MMLLALLLQAAPATSASAAPPQRFSILYDGCPVAKPGSRDVVVCGADAATAQRLPLPDEAPPTPNYVKPDSGDYRDNAMQGPPCSATLSGCLVGFGPPIVEWAKAGVHALQAGARTRREKETRRRDGARRVAIPLDGEGPKGRLEP